MLRMQYRYLALIVTFFSASLTAKAQIQTNSQPVTSAATPPAQTYQQQPIQQQPIIVQQAPPVTTAPQSAVVLPPNVVYVAPMYPSPGVGFVWEYHPTYGWGWHHPSRGWHRGWR
jgi:hypothetical protein